MARTETGQMPASLVLEGEAGGIPRQDPQGRTASMQQGEQEERSGEATGAVLMSARLAVPVFNQEGAGLAVQTLTLQVV